MNWVTEFTQYYNDMSLPFTLRDAAHTFTTEAIANYFGRLATNPAWMNYMGIIDEKEMNSIADDSFRALRLQQLVFSRWAQVMYRFEKAMYENPDQDLNQLWWDIVEKYQMVKKPEGRDMPDWASKIHIALYPCYYHNYLLGELLASQFNNYVTTNVVKGNTEADMKAMGEYFKTNVFMPGARYQWNEMIEKATGEKLTAKYYANAVCTINISRINRSHMKKYLILMIAVLTACSTPDKKGSESVAGFIDETVIKSSIEKIQAAQPSADLLLLERGVRHAASLWRAGDGTPDEFSEFVAANYISDPEKRRVVFLKISKYFESMSGNMNEITLDLRKVLDESAGEIDEIDRMFGNYSVGSHLQTDFYSNKIAFVIALNFPYYTLAEKEELGPKWSREEWAMARLGDQFVSRVPAELNQAVSVATGNAEMYIAEYNVHMGKLRTDDGRQLFPDDMVLLSHWNLRDELKANYADKETGPEKQEMIYKVMERIIRQEIPAKVINSSDYEWSPFSNKTVKEGSVVELAAEPDTRYSHVINIFNAWKALSILTIPE